MDCSTPGLPVHHQLPEFTQTHVHQVGDAIQPSHPPSSPCPPSIFPSIRVFSNESVLCLRWPKYWNFSFSISPSNEYSGLISFRTHWLDLLAIQGTLKSLLRYFAAMGSFSSGLVKSRAIHASSEARPENAKGERQDKSWGESRGMPLSDAEIMSELLVE